MMNARKQTLIAACLICLLSAGAWGAGSEAPAPAAAPAADPGAGAPPPMPGGLPPMPTELPPMPGAMPPMPGGMPAMAPVDAMPAMPAMSGPALPMLSGASSAGAPAVVSTPPPLTGLLPTDASPSTATAPAATSVGPIDNYEFLYREDDDLGSVRDKYTYEEALRIKQNEINRFLPKYQAAGGQQQGQQGQDPRAGAEWDLYYQQLELYAKYVKERLLPGATDLTEPTYDVANSMQERMDLKASYDRAAMNLRAKEMDENQDFYDKLQQREDRRRAFLDWIAEKQREVDQWAKRWAPNVNGARWAAGDQPTRLDDWELGMNYGAAETKLISVEGQKFLMSRDPQSAVPANQINVVSSHLTPYDIIDRNGDIKRPETERLRMLQQPATAAPAPPAAGTIEAAQ